MSTAIAVYHGSFGRAALYRLNRPLAPHAHREGHLVFLVSGAAAVVEVDGSKHRADATRAVAISPWQPHDFRPGDFGDGALFLTLYITPRWFRERAFCNGGVTQFGAASVALDREMRGTVARIADMLACGHTGATLTQELGDLVATAFARSWGQASARARPTSVRDFRIRNALALMNARLSDACALDRIARDAGMSRPHFYKLFRQNLGVTPNMYLNTLRLECSIQRLVWSRDPVTSIGLDLGFASQASFTRFFSNNVGIAPTDYRRCALVAA